MEKTANPESQRAKSGVALLLTLAAGLVDIIGFLGVYHTFTAQMTGTTVHLGNWLVQRNWGGAVVAGGAVTAFVFGSIAGRIVIEVGWRRGIRSIASVTLGLEVLLLAVFIPLASWQTGGGQVHPASTAWAGALLAMLAAAMGLQTATLTRVGGLTVHTTFVTGMLNKLAQLVAHLLFRTYDLLRAGRAADSVALQKDRRDTGRKAAFLFVIWLCYLAGAMAGSFLESRWKLKALYAPISLLLIGIVIDQLRPFSIGEVQD